MTDEKAEKIKLFEKKFDDLDNKKDGKMDKEEFNSLYAELEGQNEIAMEESNVMFNGIDIDNSGEISKEEFMELVKALIEGDEMYQYKLIFRSFDKDRSKKLDSEEILEICKYLKKEITKEQIQEFIQKETGKKDGQFTFSLFYNILTGKRVPQDFDPYDNKLKSGCCLLI